MKHDAHDIIRRPLITEKGTEITATLNGYTFAVANYANKVEIRMAVESLFDVKVESVKTMMRQGKRKGKGVRAYKKPDWKRAVVTLRDGDSIEFL